MQLMTSVPVAPLRVPLEHQEPVMFIGSCFAVNFARRFAENLFMVNENPFGIIYDPLSIERALTRIAENKKYGYGDLLEYRGRYLSLDHHGEFTRGNPELTLTEINDRLQIAHDFLTRAGLIFITLGTSSVFFHRNRPVANCHRLPQQEFTRQRLSHDETTRALMTGIKKIKEVNPCIRIVLTVSPVRHLRDGLVESGRNKARLIAAAGDIIEADQEIGYFPSYEIMLDELRDYRFYAADMLHPSDQAVTYIWEKLSENFFSAECKRVIAGLAPILAALDHRPLEPESDEHRQFRADLQEKIRKLESSYPHLKLNALK